MIHSFKVSVLAVLTASFVLSSAQATPQEKARELMKTMEVRKHIDSSQEQVMKFASQMIDSQGLNSEESEAAKASAKASMGASFETMKKLDWEGVFAEIYGAVFTEEELQGLIDFYKSPVGQKFLNKQPKLMMETMQKMQEEMAKIMPQIQQDIQKAIEEARASQKAE